MALYKSSSSSSSSLILLLPPPPLPLLLLLLLLLVIIIVLTADSPGHLDEPERYVHHNRRRHLHARWLPAPGGIHVPRSRHPLLPLYPVRLRSPLHLLHGQHERRVVGHEGDPSDDRPAGGQGEGKNSLLLTSTFHFTFIWMSLQPEGRLSNM